MQMQVSTAAKLLKEGIHLKRYSMESYLSAGGMGDVAT
jgi:hypothetical protein